MRSKILVVLIAVATIGVSSTAMAKGAGGGGGGSMGMHGHGHMGCPVMVTWAIVITSEIINSYLAAVGGRDSAYGSTTGTQHYRCSFAVRGGRRDRLIATTPCHWNEKTFNVPSSREVLGQSRS